MKLVLSKRKIILLIVIVFVVFSLLILLVKHYRAKGKQSPDFVVVEVEQVKLSNIPIEVKAVGTLVAAKSVQITSEFTGLVADIYFQDGALVRQGAPLIQLDNKVQKSQAESTKAALNYSETNYKRMVLLGKQGVISRQAIESAQADLKQKQADAQENEIKVDKMHFVALFAGVVGKSNVNVGDYVTVGKALVTLTDIQHLRVEYTVAEKFFPELKIGQEIKVTTNAYPNKEFSGKIAYIAPTINPEDRTIALYADIPNEDRLLTAGLFVNVTHLLGNQINALLISPQSLVPTIEGEKIFKVVQGKAVSVPVMTGQRNTDSVQIIQGITQSDIIITAGQEKLKDGMSVTFNSEQKKIAA